MKYLDFFRSHIPALPAPNNKSEVLVKCIFHRDTDASLGINLESGKWKCFSSSCVGSRGGGYKKFDQLVRGEVQGVVIETEPIDPGIIKSHHIVLKSSATMMAMLKTARGLTEATIDKFELGWDADRIWIPIKDTRGHYVNVRKYKKGAARDKMIPYATGYNRARLFPVENLKSDWVLVCEGEMDCLVACQYGYPAITATGGADTWLEEFSEQLRGKKVVMCYDADPAGRKGAHQAAVKLLGYASEVRVMRLPLAGTKEEKDVTNYFVDLGHTKQEFDALIESAELIENKVQKRGPADEVVDLHLSNIGQDVYVGRRIRSTVLIAGKDLAPFQVPRQIAFKCDAVGSEKMCDRCGICRADGQLDVLLPEYSEKLLEMVGVPIEKLNAILGRLAGVPDRCPKYKFETLKHVNVEAIKAIPEIDFDAEQSAYVIRNLFYLGHGLETNHTYKMESVVMPDPKTQYATALIYKAEPAQDVVEKFELVVGMEEILKKFQTEVA